MKQKRLSQSLLAVLMAVALLISLIPAALAAEGGKHITILGTSDMHGNIWGYSYEDNKEYLLQRMQQENNPVICRLCEQDIQYLDDIQQEMATARDFYILLRLQEGEKQHPERQQLEKALKEQGFEAGAASHEDVKRMLALYYTQHPVDHTDEIDGGRWLG